MAYYSIGEVAERCGINPVTLRAWQRRYGLLKPQRSEGGHRQFDDEDILRIEEIKRLMKSFDKNLRRREGTEIDGGARPIENNSVNTIHDGSLFRPVHGITNGGKQGRNIGIVHLANVADTEAVAL